MSEHTPPEIFIGFDAREWWLGEEIEWGAPWKKNYFLRFELEKPLCIDRLVWPSLFDFSAKDEPGWTGCYKNCWANLQELVDFLPHEEFPEKPFIVAGFSVVLEQATEDEIRHREIWGSDVSQEEIDPDWYFFGYDVADWSAYSGLLTTRPRYDFDHPEPMRKEWGPHLNRWHLFNDVEPAMRFKEYCNRGLAKLAPFFVYGIWLARSFNGGGPKNF